MDKIVDFCQLKYEAKSTTSRIIAKISKTSKKRKNLNFPLRSIEQDITLHERTNPF